MSKIACGASFEAMCEPVAEGGARDMPIIIRQVTARHLGYLLLCLPKKDKASSAASRANPVMRQDCELGIREPCDVQVSVRVAILVKIWAPTRFVEEHS